MSSYRPIRAFPGYEISDSGEVYLRGRPVEKHVDAYGREFVWLEPQMSHGSNKSKDHPRYKRFVADLIRVEFQHHYKDPPKPCEPVDLSSEDLEEEFQEYLVMRGYELGFELRACIGVYNYAVASCGCVVNLQTGRHMVGSRVGTVQLYEMRDGERKRCNRSMRVLQEEAWGENPPWVEEPLH